MPSFIYSARTKEGAVQGGTMEGVNEDEVVAVLQNKGLIVTSLSKKESNVTVQARRRMVRRLHGGVKSDDKVLFCQQLATLLEAGIPLLKSLEVISAQVESRQLLIAVEQMRQDIEAGKTFKDALAKHPKIFSSFWVNLVETGEASGHLAQSLLQLAKYLESMRELQQKAITAVTYPAVLILAAAAALALFVLKIIPIFSGIFASMNMKLPPLTAFIIGFSDAVRQYAVVIFLALAVGGYGVSRFVQTDQGKWIVDRMSLRLPIFSTLFLQLQLAQFARGLSTLLESGVPILFSLEIMESSASNKVYGRSIGEIREFVRGGKTMADPMQQTGLYPAMMVQMVQVGEEIGELGKMLGKVASYYEGRVETFIERMTVLFEPIAIMVMAVVIGILVISMFMPIFSMAGGFQTGG